MTLVTLNQHCLHPKIFLSVALTMTIVTVIAATTTMEVKREAYITIGVMSIIRAIVNYRLI